MVCMAKGLFRYLMLRVKRSDIKQEHQKKEEQYYLGLYGLGSGAEERVHRAEQKHYLVLHTQHHILF